jgi:NADH-quinone oxidoreductase subunit H
LSELLAENVPTWISGVVVILIAAVLVISFIGVSALLLIWGERKVSGRIQDRLGPTRVGPIGILQSLADGIKLITKEDTSPRAADRWLFLISPYLAFCATFCGFLALPFGNALVAQDLGIAAFFVLAVLSTEVFGVLLAGYSSGSKWSLFGGVREAAQVVSYEVPRSLCVIVPICITGTLNLAEIGRQQVGWFWEWNLFHDPFTYVAFFIFFITATASCKRAPFDLAEAESELVAGFHTEYSGIRWSYFFMAEYGSMFAVSALSVHLFLGGWHSGFLSFEPTEQFGFWGGNLINLAVFISKSLMLIFVMMWLRWSLPRLRIDQVMMTCLKYFLPVSCGLLLGVCLWQLFVSVRVAELTRLILAGMTAATLVIFLASLVLISEPRHRGGKSGVWADDTGVRT